MHESALFQKPGFLFSERRISRTLYRLMHIDIKTRQADFV
ncbi:hypothetical protein BRADI_3g59485v3 [Brachypodium distachyon]|uniref:Uncharacterized protein n=1 Tax=Brachypodium distachyon TaxID=15368 RepID=A0A2K2D5U6_BRADI|nr:hypothetical protein BRADI_3g59485v3 [Brachypodium distachyon]